MDRHSALQRGFVVTATIVLALGWCIAAQTLAQTVQLRPLSPPDDALPLILGPDNTVKLTLAPDNPATRGPVNLTLHSFWTKDGSPVNVVVKDGTNAADRKKAQVEFGEPVVLQVPIDEQPQTNGTPQMPMVWGYIEANYGGNNNAVNLPVAIGPFGPSIKPTGTLSIPATGRTKLELDMSQYVPFGTTAQFRLTRFSSGSHESQPRFFNANANDGDTLTVRYSADNPVVWFEIDAGEFHPDTEYRGAIRTAINNKQFIDRPLILKKTPWTAEASFAPIQPVITTDKAVFTIQTTSDQAIRGISVTSATAAKDGFDPRNDLDVKLDGMSLWTLKTGTSQEIRARSLVPGEIKEIVVTPLRELIAGKHEVALLVGALNVDTAKWAEAKITFVVRNHWFWAVAVLIVAVLMSYGITKGVVTLMHRRNLRIRIADIKDKSWLKNDRWGALPIVRAFVRVELADKALKDKPYLSPIRLLSRLVTAPQLISDEVEEVGKRLETFKKLNKLAIYWRAAPSDTGSVGDIDYRIVWRAQKVLRSIVNQLSQLQKGEEIPADVDAKLDKLETWSQDDSLQTEYLAAQRFDIERLLVRVDWQRFEFDETALDQLIDNLQAIEQINYNQTITDAAKAALDACQSFEDDGMKTLNKALQPLTALVDDKSVKDQALINHARQIRQNRETLLTGVRETVRDLVEKLGTQKLPDSMREIMAVEDTYIRLKLIWEQRWYPDRYKDLVAKMHSRQPLEAILKAFDDEIWSLLKQSGSMRIVNPAAIAPVEQYALTDFKVECTNTKANTFLFKHGLQYEWCIDWGGEKPLKPITRCPMVTQFIPQIDKNRQVKMSVVVRRDSEECPGENDNKIQVFFKTLPANRYKNLWPTNTPELLGVAIAVALALVAGFQSDAFAGALEGSWKKYLTLFAWGVGAEQIKTLIQNLEMPFKNSQAKT